MTIPEKCPKCGIEGHVAWTWTNKYDPQRLINNGTCEIEVFCLLCRDWSAHYRVTVTVEPVESEDTHGQD